MSPTGPCLASGETTCIETPVITDPVSLCEEHALQVSLQVVPGLLSRRLAETRSRNDDGTSPLPPRDAHMVSSAVSVPMPETESHHSLVYFLANGGRVKIGQSRSLYNRIRSLSLRPDAVLLLLQGGASLERALHAKFMTRRIANSEWFELSPEIVRFIGSKAHGRPLRRPSEIRPRNGDDPQSANQQVKDSKASAVRAMRLALPDAPAQQIADALAPHGITVNANYVRTVLSRASSTDPQQGTGGYL